MHEHQDPWQPILEDALRERAEEHVRAIVADLRTMPALHDPSLAGGHAGVGLLFGYLAAAGARPDAAAQAREHLDRAARALAEIVLPPGLYTGFTGIAWSHCHLERESYESADGDPAEEIDDAVLQLLERTPWPYHYDLVSGLVGVGVYALERLPRPRARETLRRVVARLHEISRSDADGIYWYTPLRLLPLQARAQTPDGSCNLGIAHGTPGAIALLAAIVAHDDTDVTAARLLEGALDWLCAQRLPASTSGWFAIDAAGLARHEPARLAWCYGDAGIAACLHAASRVLDHSRLRELALRIGRDATQRDPVTAGVVDAGLCHGAAGLGHVFNRLFQSSGEEVFLDAARAWFGRTLDLRRQDLGLGGYRAWTRIEDTFGWRADPGLLTGAAGVAAALLAATSRVAPAWDRFLLLSVAAPAATAQQTSPAAASARRGDA